jgi:PAS domain S-box-containing protein
MRLTAQFLLLLGALLAAIGVITGISLSSLTRIDVEVHAVVREGTGELLCRWQLGEVLEELVEAEPALLLSPVPASWAAGKARLQPLAELARQPWTGCAFGDDPAEAGRVEALRAAGQRWAALDGRLLELVEQGKGADARRLFEEQRAEAAEVLATSKSLLEHTKDHLRQRAKFAEEQSDRKRTALLLTALAALAVALVAGVSVFRGIRAGHASVVRSNEGLESLVAERTRALALSEERFRQIVLSSAVATFVIDPEHRVTHWNRACELLTGISADQVVGTSDHWRSFYTTPQPMLADSLLDGVELDRIKERYPAHRVERSQLSKGSWEVEGQFVSPKGAPRWVSLTATTLRDDAGRILGAMETIQDLTARQAAERAQRESEQRARLVLEQGPMPIFLQKEGRFLYLNPAAVKLLGAASAVEMIGQVVTDRFRRESSAQAGEEGPAGRTAPVGPGQATVSEMRLLRVDGKERDAQLHVVPLPDQSALTDLVFALDVTDRRAYERQLVEARVAAEAASRAKSDFLANVSHELRTPLNGVLGLLGLLLDSNLAEEQRDLGESAHACGETLLGLLNDILDLSKLEAEKLELESLDFDPRDLVSDSSAMLEPTAKSRGLTLTWSVDERVPNLVCGDPGRLRQVLMNLLSNAIKFTPQGSIAVRTELVRSDKGSALVRFAVRDSGIGIPAHKLPELFRPFVQVDASTTRRYGGSGLGLAICRDLVQLMSGEIGATSTESRGSEFWFVVPLALRRSGTLAEFPRIRLRSQPVVAALRRTTPQDLALLNRTREKLAALPANPAGDLGASAQHPPGPAPRWAKKRVLVAEDNAVNQQVALGYLRRLGVGRADAVADGAEAVHALEVVPYDLVLMDVQMPELDGIEATRRIRSATSAVLDHQIPIVALTAHTQAEDRRECVEAGMNDFLTKPVSADALGTLLERIFAAGAQVLPVAAPFDREAFLKQFDGDEEVGRCVLETFEADLPVRIAALATAWDKGDLKSAQREAHSVKGAAAAVACPQLNRTAADLEKAFKDGELDRAKRLFADLRLRAEEVLPYIREALQSEVATS